jgi:hypothetical protein
MNAIATKKRRSKGEVTATAQPDYGPPERWARGDVERGYRPDPDAPHRIVSGARVVARYVEAWRRGQITDAEREAADKWEVLTARAGGASACYDATRGEVRAEPWRRTPPEAQLAAITQLRHAREIVGRDAAALLDAWIVHNVCVTALVTRPAENRHQVMGRIRAALVRLAELWGIA